MARSRKEAFSNTSDNLGKHSDAGVPSWLRRPYTRTIPAEIRTTAQLTLSFEDIRKQWRNLCETFTYAQEESVDDGSSTVEMGVSREARTIVEGLVSQLKSVKQELLAHLSKLSGAVDAPSSSPPSGTTDRQLPAWVVDLMRQGSPSPATMSAVGHIPEEMRRYLQAIWLARRVWVWSVCFASILMDLELLSGSVSVATELFFGSVLQLAVTPEEMEALAYNDNNRAMDSSYNKSGSITEDLLYEVIEAEVAAAPKMFCSDAADCCTHDGNFPPSTSYQLREEAAEMFYFFGCSIAKTQSITETVTRTDDEKNSLPGVCATAPIRDLLWVHAVSLCYSVTVRDDRSASRLLAVFEAAKHALSTGLTESCAESEISGEEALKTAPEKFLSSGDPQTLWSVIVFVLGVAKTIVDEDYQALQRIFYRAGLVEAERIASEDGGVDKLLTSSSSLLALCPQCLIFRFLIRLLEEHVVRRRWIEDGIGKAFRPIEPSDAPDNAAASAGVGRKDAHPYRLACVLKNRARSIAARERATVSGIGMPTQLFQGTWKLCDALQMGALGDMGGDWPVPPAMLRTTMV